MTVFPEELARELERQRERLVGQAEFAPQRFAGLSQPGQFYGKP